MRLQHRIVLTVEPHELDVVGAVLAIAAQAVFLDRAERPQHLVRFLMIEAALALQTMALAMCEDVDGLLAEPADELDRAVLEVFGAEHPDVPDAGPVLGEGGEGGGAFRSIRPGDDAAVAAGHHLDFLDQLERAVVRAHVEDLDRIALAHIEADELEGVVRPVSDHQKGA